MSGIRMDRGLGSDPVPATRRRPEELTINFRYLTRLHWPTVRALGWVIVISRLLFMEIAALAYIYLPHAWVEAPPGTLPPPGGLLYRILFGLWVHWDGLWYLSIATFGYQSPTSTAFFPLYPVAMRLLGDGVVAGVLISLAAFAIFIWIFFHLVAIDLGPRAAWWAVVAVAFFPTAFYANAAYSESLFLMLAAGSLYFTRTRRYFAAGPMALLATLVSMYGILLAIPMGLLILREEGWRLRPLWHTLWAPAGLALYMLYLLPTFGDPLVFEKAQSNWGRHFELFFVTLWRGLTAAIRTWPSAVEPRLLFAGGQPGIDGSNVYNFLFAIAALILLAVTARRIPFYLWAYSLAALLVPLSFPASGTPLMSMPRLVLEAFPLFAGLGVLLSQSSALRWTYFLITIPLGLLFVSLFATAHWVA